MHAHISMIHGHATFVPTRDHAYTAANAHMCDRTICRTMPSWYASMVRTWSTQLHCMVHFPQRLTISQSRVYIRMWVKTNQCASNGHTAPPPQIAHQTHTKTHPPLFQPRKGRLQAASHPEAYTHTILHTRKSQHLGRFTTTKTPPDLHSKL